MKKLIRFIIIIFFATWVLFMGAQILIDKSRGRDINFIKRGISTTIILLAPLLGGILGTYSIFPRLKYLENYEITKPDFEITCSSVIDMSNALEFNCLKTKIANKCLITFSDDIHHVLKFRTKWRLSTNLGAAAWLKYDNETAKLYIEYFPLEEMQYHLARKLKKEIERYHLD